MPASVSHAAILAAGFGTRLRPLTVELPKPLVPVGDRSVLAHAANNLHAMGVEHVVINTHHLANRYDANTLSRELDMEVTLNHETTIRGTAGGIAGAVAHTGEGPLIVHNGDILAELDWPAFLARHHRSDAIATLAVRAGLDPGSGPVGLDAEDRVVRLRDRAFGQEIQGAEFVGIHLVSAALARRLPFEGCMVGDVYIPGLASGQHIQAADVVHRYTDVGTLSEYLRANREWLGERPHYQHPEATVSDTIRLEKTIIGKGATVTGSGPLTRCVVWPGARATAPLSDAVVTSHGAHTL